MSGWQYVSLALGVWLLSFAMRGFYRGWRRGMDATPRASDGSRFWGRRNAEANAGKVVTKESGPAPVSSRERAAEALARAQAETVLAPAPSVVMAGPLPQHVTQWEDGRLTFNGEFIGWAEGKDPVLVDARACARDARSEAAQLRGALTECRRELAEARAAQAVPVPTSCAACAVRYGTLLPTNPEHSLWRVEPGYVYCQTGTETISLSGSVSIGANTVTGPPRTDGTAS